MFDVMWMTESRDCLKITPTQYERAWLKILHHDALLDSLWVRLSRNKFTAV